MGEGRTHAMRKYRERMLEAESLDADGKVGRVVFGGGLTKTKDIWKNHMETYN